MFSKQRVYRPVRPVVAPHLRVLFVVAAPADSKPSDPMYEIREIRDELARMPARLALATEVVEAPTLDELHRALLICEPNIIHFSGHAAAGEIRLRDDDRTGGTLSSSSLARLLAAQGEQLHLVMLSMCNSDDIARVVTEVVPCAIGFAASVDYETARAFSVALYRSLIVELPVSRAFEQATAFSTAMHGLDTCRPRLHWRDGVEPGGEPGGEPGKASSRARVTRMSEPDSTISCPACSPVLLTNDEPDIPRSNPARCAGPSWRVRAGAGEATE